MTEPEPPDVLEIDRFYDPGSGDHIVRFTAEVDGRPGVLAFRFDAEADAIAMVDAARDEPDAWGNVVCAMIRAEAN